MQGFQQKVDKRLAGSIFAVHRPRGVAKAIDSSFEKNLLVLFVGNKYFTDRFDVFDMEILLEGGFFGSRVGNYPCGDTQDDNCTYDN